MKTLSQRHQNTPARGATTIAREDLLPYLGRSPIYRGTRACPYHARHPLPCPPNPPRHTSPHLACSKNCKGKSLSYQPVPDMQHHQQDHRQRYRCQRPQRTTIAITEVLRSAPIKRGTVTTGMQANTRFI